MSTYFNHNRTEAACLTKRSLTSFCIWWGRRGRSQWRRCRCPSSVPPGRAFSTVASVCCFSIRGWKGGTDTLQYQIKKQSTSRNRYDQSNTSLSILVYIHFFSFVILSIRDPSAQFLTHSLPICVTNLFQSADLRVYSLSIFSPGTTSPKSQYGARSDK